MSGNGNRGSKTLDRWQAYWAVKVLPEHAQDTEELYRLHAQELRVLLGEKPLGRVLEIGCGNGALYSYLGFDQARYRGVDFSPSMLDVFRKRFPGADLVQEEGSSYVEPGATYDLIFSDGVIQYFNTSMLDRHLACARTMMNQDSRLICGSIPWKAQRWRYYAGLFPPHFLSHVFSLPLLLTRNALQGDPIGQWYRIRHIQKLAERNCFSVSFYGSLVYLHRFHAVLRLKPPQPTDASLSASHDKQPLSRMARV